MEQNTTDMISRDLDGDSEIVIDLRDLFSTLWSHLLLIAEAGLCLGAIAFLISTLLLSRQYVSTTKIYILNTQSDSVTYSDLQSSSSLTNDYQELITSLPVLEQVTTQLHLSYSSDELADHISVSSPTDTRIIYISVTDTDPYLAHDIANAVRVEASAQISQVMDIEAVNVVQEASYPTSASSPNTVRYALIGCIAGVFLSVVVIFVLYIIDDSIKTPEDVEKVMGVSVLGSIPLLESETVSRKKRTRRKRQRGGRSGERVGARS